VQTCYEDCLGTYQQEVQRQCGDEWIAIRGCLVHLECEDLFGDCDPIEEVFNECVEQANNRVYCETTCPEVDLAECVQLYASTGTCGEPRLRNLVYCENPDAAAPSCDLAGFSPGDDSALRTKLEGCAVAGCHGTDGTAVTTWTLDLSGSVEGALSPLTSVIGLTGDYLIDDFDPDCSFMLTKLTGQPGGGSRQPLTPPYWSTAEIDCFRSYLHEF